MSKTYFINDFELIQKINLSSDLSYVCRMEANMFFWEDLHNVKKRVG
jgi:hypothetical protein